jgi:uncharacterized protein (TIGR02217 family)
VANSVKIAVDGVVKTQGTHFTVNTASGIVTFTGGNIPEEGEAVTAGFEFDVPVRLDTDALEINLKLIEAGDIANIPIVEIRL